MDALQLGTTLKPPGQGVEDRFDNRIGIGSVEFGPAHAVLLMEFAYRRRANGTYVIRQERSKRCFGRGRTAFLAEIDDEIRARRMSENFCAEDRS